MASTDLATTFGNDTAQNAYDVHVLVPTWDGQVVDMEMDFSPTQAIHFKSHGQANQLDVESLLSDGVIPNADHTATYLSFEGYEKAVVYDYNEAMRGAASIYNDIMENVDPGRQGLNAPQIDGVYDVNNLHWEFTDRMLESAISSAEHDVANIPELQTLIEQGNEIRMELANAGANAQAASLTWYQNVKPPAPGMDPVEGADLSKYEVQSEEVSIGIDNKAAL